MLNRDELRRRIYGALQGGRKPYQIRNADGADGNPAVLRIMEEVGLWGLSAEQFAAELSQVTADEIEVQISSPGGDIFDGIAVYNQLRAHPARITTRTDGIAASIASVIFQAGDRRVMLTGSQMMVHEAWSIAIGTADDMRKLADTLDRQTDVITNIFAERTGRPAFGIRQLLEAETWLTAEEAVKEGFADEVVKPAGRRKAATNRLSPEDQKVIASAQHHVWQYQRALEAKKAYDALIATEIAVERDRLNAILSNPPTSKRVDYVETTVDSKRWGIANSTLRAAAAELGIAPPEVRWFREAKSGEKAMFRSAPVNGVWRDGTVWLSAALSVDRLSKTVRHEVAHAAGKDEVGAQNFAKRKDKQ